jgi:DNA invertase Pin-like site-specific DNA recombinase
MNNETIVKRHAYSYIRFSSVEQAKGDSFRRQTARTEEFCKSHNLILNDTRYADLGVSGWKGKNMETGALGVFLLALKAGKLEKNSVLVVENFDRFSRLKPRKAYEKLAEIIEAGVDVVTLEDGKFHTKATLDDFATLITSLAIMQRANEESSRKSSLIGASWAQKRKLAREGKAVLSGHCPSWLRQTADGKGFEPIPERVKLVHRIVRLVKAGKGKREIARMLDAEKVPTWSRAKCWRDNYILELVKSRCLLGELHLQKRKNPNGEPVKNYYPAVVDEATWLSIQPEKRKVFNAGPQTDVNNLFSGLLFDGYHPDYHMKFFIHNKAKNYIYLQSDYATVDPLYRERSQAKAKGGKPGARPLSGTSVKYREFEQHFMRHFSEIDLHGTLPVKPAAESSRLALLAADKKENDKALINLVKALESGQPSAVVMAQIEKREAADKKLAKELAAEEQKQKVERHAVDSFEEEQERLTELLEADTREARLSLRALFHRIIQRIDIYTAGLLDVPANLKTTVYPDRCGMMCYSIQLVGSYKIWIWWDGCQVWAEPDAKTAAAVDLN